MATDPITVRTTARAPRDLTWHYYTDSDHIVNWNFASSDWHCPAAENDLRIGGDFRITMAARDGSMSFDMAGTYNAVQPEKHLAYTFTNGRRVTVDFAEEGGATEVTVTFDPENEYPLEQQREGWQAILDNFGRYAGEQAAQG
ncbi:uncharacterized protein YndB with AHSA1/START domain [Lewinella marina]|uniref:Polyketide cyclase n=1 Tax=Neolewinella marina TaxID=438751 RepID=A0A2G0CGG6_9BACT|nr:SRPBCC domain-containing protein [Neolewinella marina]NJB86474.1 uncharacterized protein YndB with AHSA1/START domain [Neolewinella marina]PHK99066.1 polyketide cyclase [Neolewinella marina]